MVKLKELYRIVVDLTPILPGGDNGGAKLVATELVRHLSRSVAPECDYVLLTSDDTHNELAWLDAPNVRRLCINLRAGGTVDTNQRERKGDRNFIHWVGGTLERWLPHRWYQPIYRLYRINLKQPKSKNILQELGADLLFCPFTAPIYYHADVPVVIVVYDLQFQAYPQFFSGEDLYHLDHYMRQSCQVASRLVCISEHTRQMVLAQCDLPPEQVQTIPLCLINPLAQPTEDEIAATLASHRLIAEEYLLYPANFWPHKNHEMLLTAFQRYRAQNPASNLKLVLTGAGSDRADFLKAAATQMNLEDDIVFAGFVDTKVFSVLMAGCLSLIFPSLYEGFGLPVLEAMNFGKPVLCSNLTSLPEVAGDAAHYFDPRKPDEIADAIESVASDLKYRQQLAVRGHSRVTEFQHPLQWASAYFDIFCQVVESGQQYRNSISGVYPDDWIGETVAITVSKSRSDRWLELNINVPPWLSKPFLRVKVSTKIKYRIPRGERQTLRIPLTERTACFKISFSPTMSPLAAGINTDQRLLSCQLVSCHLVSPGQRETLFSTET